MDKYNFTENMGEISGFGGGYEEACRAMLKAGLEWCDANPTADPQFRGGQGVYGMLEEDNEDAKALSKALLDGAGGDCTGAMHQAVFRHIMFIRQHGWNKYVEGMTNREERKTT
jgi:hypothetical protein